MNRNKSCDNTDRDSDDIHHMTPLSVKLQNKHYIYSQECFNVKYMPMMTFMMMIVVDYIINDVIIVKDDVTDDVTDDVASSLN